MNQVQPGKAHNTNQKQRSLPDLPPKGRVEIEEIDRVLHASTQVNPGRERHSVVSHITNVDRPLVIN